MRNRKYKTLEGLMKAMNTNQLTADRMQSGQFYYSTPNIAKGFMCRFELPSDVTETYWHNLAKVVWKNPRDWQVQKMQYAQCGLYRRLWYDSRYKTYEYCAGQDYDGEIRTIQRCVNKS